MDLNEMYEMGRAAGEEELEKLAHADDDGLEVLAGWKSWRAGKAAKKKSKLLKKLKKAGGGTIGSLSRGRKAGLGAALAAAAYGGSRYKNKG